MPKPIAALLGGLVLLPMVSALLADDPPPRLEEASLAERREHVLSLSPEQQAELQQKRDRFEQLPAAERQRIRQLHDVIQAAPDRDALQSALRWYQQWLATLPSAQRAELLSLPPAERVAEMKSIREGQAARRMLASTPLEMSDYMIIKRWLYGFVRRHEEELVAQLPEQFRRRWESTQQPRRYQMLANAVARDGLSVKLDEADVRMMLNNLSAPAREALDAAGSGRGELLREWLRLASQYQRPAPDVSNEQLREFFNELDERSRQRLETLPPAELRTALVRLYQLSRSTDSPADASGRVRVFKAGPLKAVPLRRAPNNSPTR